MRITVKRSRRLHGGAAAHPARRPGVRRRPVRHIHRRERRTARRRAVDRGRHRHHAVARACSTPSGPDDDVVLPLPGRDGRTTPSSPTSSHVLRRSNMRIHVIAGTEIGDDETDLLGVPTLQRGVPDIAARDCFVCGPPALIDAVCTAARRCSACRRARSTTNASSSRRATRHGPIVSRAHQPSSSRSWACRARDLQDVARAGPTSSAARHLPKTTGRPTSAPPPGTTTICASRRCDVVADDTPHHERRDHKRSDHTTRTLRRRPVRQPVRHRPGAGHVDRGTRSPAVTPLQMPNDHQRSPRSARKPSRSCCQEALQAQSAQIDIIGGARRTRARATRSRCRAALDKAGMPGPRLGDGRCAASSSNGARSSASTSATRSTSAASTRASPGSPRRRPVQHVARPTPRSCASAAGELALAERRDPEVRTRARALRADAPRVHGAFDIAFGAHRPCRRGPGSRRWIRRAS